MVCRVQGLGVLGFGGCIAGVFCDALWVLVLGCFVGSDCGCLTWRFGWV